MSKKTVILGATTNTERYAYAAAGRLVNQGHEIVPIGIKKGTVLGVDILDLNTKPAIEAVDTITLYIGTRHQEAWYTYILGLKPKRIIFNPGTENNELAQMATEKGIVVEEACTLVMLATGQY